MSISEERGNFFGVRVLELGQGVAAPYCGMLLAQNGATVTKIEPLGEGDWSRKLGQSYGEFSANALVANWGKKSVSLDLKSEQGQAIVQKLARESDVIIENYRPGVTKRLGLDYDLVIQHNKTVVYASLTGFGNVGPNKNLPRHRYGDAGIYRHHVDQSGRGWRSSAVGYAGRRRPGRSLSFSGRLCGAL